MITKRFIVIFVSLLLVLGMFGCADQGVSKKIANAYGMKDMDKLAVLRFTFNVRMGERSISRSWEWEAATGQVTYKVPGLTDKKYLQKDISTGTADESTRDMDKLFTNDQYWLIFPLHLEMDKEAEKKHEPGLNLPIPPGTADCVLVTYPKVGGYTPGDVYELYYDENFMLKQWVYRPGGSETPSRITTWEKHAKAGPFVFSLEHNGAEGDFRVWFTNVAVKLNGSSDWIEAG